ncbi:hypothetical protein O3P69_013630 [Scylla paramamosain]|uniref:Uncharacterized protein n=1 Tax=Scylla paramamosain TaxID=85552 RepID=A0AAW0SQR7_SCYPA
MEGDARINEAVDDKVFPLRCRNARSFVTSEEEAIELRRSTSILHRGSEGQCLVKCDVSCVVCGNGRRTCGTPTSRGEFFVAFVLPVIYVLRYIIVCMSLRTNVLFSYVFVCPAGAINQRNP